MTYRELVKMRQEKRAEKMKNATINKLGDVAVCKTVRVPIDQVPKSSKLRHIQN
jgi:hypothetical protein